MKKEIMKKPTALFSLALLLAGCRYDLPAVDAGSVETHSFVGGVDQATMTKLSPAQIKALAEWFSAHPTGWSYRIADMAPGAFLYLKHGGQNVAGVNLRPEGIYVASYFRALTAAEHARLESMIATPKG